MNPDPSVQAALVVIGNEILSGRTQDANLNAIAKRLATIGIPLREVRVVADIHAEIADAVNALRHKYTYVFTTGGIGPTHDDITVDAIAVAFGVKVIIHPEARALLARHYGEENLTDARLRMARVPEGATLIDNPVSTAPGIKMENVYVMAGVPNIMQAMMDAIISTLRHGPVIHAVTVSGFIAESVVAEELARLALGHPELDIGSYPWVKDGRFGTALVTRGTDIDKVRSVAQKIQTLVGAKGVEATLSEE